MKKILSFAFVVCLAGMASAVNMKWESAAAIKFNNSNLKSDGTVTGYLIALDAFASSYAVDGNFTAANVGVVLDNKEGTSAMSKISDTWVIDTDHYGNGDKFAVLLKYTGAGDGNTYWNLSSALVSMSGMALDPPTNAANTTYAFSFGKSTTAGTLTAGGGWTAAVPEPGTAALALLGIGMLIRRRRA